MLIEDKTLWLEALRSGKYRQADGFLKVEREGKYFYCCLGVLCEVLKEKYEIRESENAIYPGVTQFDSDYASLTSKLIDKLKMNLETVSKLCSLNDIDMLTFAQIADWIDANVQVSPEATTETANTQERT